MASMMHTSLIAKIEARQARVAVIGLGYVGLPLLVALSEQGFPVTGLDVDTQKITTLHSGRSYIQDIGDDAIARLVAASHTQLSSDFERLGEADAIVICVPTPLRKSKEPDLSYILAAAEAVTAHLRSGQLIILESTTYPGTTDEILLPMFSQTGLQLGEDFLLVFSPERIDPGNPQFSVANIPKVIGGMTPACTAAAMALYGSFLPHLHPVSSARVAETAKILENTFRSVNIALVNEFAGICRAIGIDVWEVIDAAATKPFGFMKFQPGPGIGGHCIPLDPHYLIWKSRLHGYEPQFMALADQINSAMPSKVVQLVGDVLNQAGKPIKGSRILLIGVAYKPDVNDLRESPALEIAELLHLKGAQLAYLDPYIPTFETAGVSVPTAAELGNFDCGLILTHHRQGVDYASLVAALPLVVDTRNALAGNPAPHITRL
jgi:UDP-N-acetyl-D-glucosamine dehydrogenase